MNLYVWKANNGSIGLVKADSWIDAKHKVFMSQATDEVQSFEVYLLEDDSFDGYDVQLITEVL